MGGANGEFPPTHRSAVLGVRSDDESVRRGAFSAIVQGYWKPVYKHLRFKWRSSSEEAKDLTQGFFAHLLEKEHLARYDASKAAFRTYLRMCLDSFASNEHKAAGRVKRGGGVATLSLNFDDAESEWAGQSHAASVDVDGVFEREWVRHLFSSALDEFRATCDRSGKQIQSQIFQRYDLAESTPRPNYEQLGAEFEIPATQVTNYLSWARREFRRHLLSKLRDVTGSDAEFRDDARTLFGAELD